MKITIITRKNGDEEFVFAKNLRNKLSGNNNVEILEMGSYWEAQIVSPLNASDLVISVGGDGTLLRTVSEMQVQRPVLGVNFGHIGFLTDIEKESAIEIIADIVQRHDLRVEKRMRIDVLINGNVIGTALNDIAIKSSYDIIQFEVCIDNVIATKFKGDGLLISTPTGSTAYALSAGGPITDPRLDCFLVVPIAPYLLSSRPQVIHSSRKLTVNANDGVMFIDGQKVEDLWPNDNQTFEFRISENPALFVDINRNFFEKVDTKLKHV